MKEDFEMEQELKLEDSERASFDLVYLDAANVRFGYEGENLTFIDADGMFHPRVTLRRCFPLSAQNTLIMVCAPGEENDRGAEIGVLKAVEELDNDSREAVTRELELHYFVPIVKCIHAIREEFGFLYWSVDTNRGKKEFIMRDSVISATRRISDGRWLIIDINQTRYEVRDFQALDSHSQDLLQRYLLL
jgi:hypothetical protein